MNIFRFLCGFLLSILVFSSAMAEEKTSKSALSKETPVTILDAATDSMMKGLDENHLKQFSAIESSYGTIRAVEDVQMSLSRAVKSCSEANQDMAKPLSDKFELWKADVRPVMKKARTKLDKMILLQGFAQPSQVRSYLKKFDAAVVYRNQGIKSVPVTTKESCEKMQDSMTKTQENLVKLLTDTLNLNSSLKVKE